MKTIEIKRPVELENEEEYPQILEALQQEALDFAQKEPNAPAESFVEKVGYRRWMSNFADYWNIPEDEQLDRREVAHIDRFLSELFEAVRQKMPKNS